VFGLRIRSEFALPELPAIDVQDAEPDVVVRRGVVPPGARTVTLNEESVLHNLGAGFLIRDGREVIVDVPPDADPATLRVLILGRVMAFVFRQRGWLPLHASGVVVNGACALFLGYPRAGKSTTAAAFHRQGHLVVTDDVAPVRIDAQGECILQSAWSSVRLRADAASILEDSGLSGRLQGGKHRYDLRRGSGGDLYPVRCAYTIEFGDHISVEPVDTMRAIPLLSRYCFVRHQAMARDALQSHLRDCSAVAARIPVRKLTRPRALGTLPDLVSFVENDLAGLS
jgi:hypothetical protein